MEHGAVSHSRKAGAGRARPTSPENAGEVVTLLEPAQGEHGGEHGGGGWTECRRRANAIIRRISAAEGPSPLLPEEDT